LAHDPVREPATGSRKENAIRQRDKHFRAKHAPAKAGVDTGSRKENAIKQRDRAFELIRSDRKMLLGIDRRDRAEERIAGLRLLVLHCEEAGKIRSETKKPAFPPVLKFSPVRRSASGPGLLPDRIRSG
jgi:hypothetical protein